MRCPGIHGLVSCVNSPVEESHPNVLPSSVNAKTCAATPGAAASSCTASRPARRESKSTATSRIGLDEISPAGMCTHEATRVLASRGGLILWWTLFTLPATVGVDIFSSELKKKKPVMCSYIIKVLGHKAPFTPYPVPVPGYRVPRYTKSDRVRVENSGVTRARKRCNSRLTGANERAALFASPTIWARPADAHRSV